MNQEHLPHWFVVTKNISFELALGFGMSLVVLKYFLHSIMKPDQYDLAVAIIIPFFLVTLILSCSRAIEVLKSLKQTNGN